MSAELAAALRRLDARLELALDAFGARRHDPFRGLYLAEDDVRRSLSGHAPEPPAWSPLAEDVPELRHAGDAFGLDATGLDALLLALAPELDLRYERVFAFLQDDMTRRRPSLDLVLTLLAGSREEALRRRPSFLRGPLLRHGLVALEEPDRPLLARPLVPDRGVVAWILGDTAVDVRIGDRTLLEERPRPVSTPAAELPAELPLRAALVSRSGSGARDVARALAAAHGRRLLVLDCAGADPALLDVARRDAALRGAVLLAEGLARPADAFADTVPAAILAVSAEPVPGVLSVELPPPGAAARRAAWARALAGSGAARQVVDEVAGRFALPLDRIPTAAADARLAAGAAGERTGRRHLFAAARAHSRTELGELARRIVPARGWDDLVLPAGQVAELRELCARVAQRGRVLEEWGFGARLSGGTGTTALFSGPSGTGKTLAAEVVAAELGLDLYRIDLSGVVSKYIGETEKNLARVFSAAEGANAVLFFDEADALFGKRSEVSDSHDRYANIEVSYLLQRMEAYEGVAVLATNLRDNLDEAFARRLAFTIPFPFPEAAERRIIWRRIWPPAVPLDPAVDLDGLADRYRLTGGEIRNAALAAAYLAAEERSPVDAAVLQRAIRAEYRKVGRTLALEEAA